MAEIKVEIKDTGDLKRLSRDLGKTAEGKELRKELGRAFRAILRPILVEVKASYSGGRHLRPALKRATRMEVQLTGKNPHASIRVDGRRMPDGMRKLPAYYEGEARWRHPVFGNKEVWVDQSPRPMFYSITSGVEPTAEREIEDATGRSLDGLERGR
jgi:hypothetical protein